MKKNQHAQASCSIARSLDIIGEWWTLLIIRELFYGRQHFEDFQKRLKIPRNTLANRLTKLVANGLLVRSEAGKDKRKCCYILTAKGKSLLPVIIALRQWGDSYLYPNEVNPTVIVSRKTNSQIRPLKVTSFEDEILELDDLAVRFAVRPVQFENVENQKVLLRRLESNPF